MQTPSIKQGLNPATEKANRSKGCQFIETVGQKLRLHQVTISTATTFLHRFYMRQPMSRYHHYDVAATCIFLATKVEENPRKLPDLITAATRFSQHNWDLEIDEQSKEYWRWRDAILYTEEQLLEALCFDFDVKHPYDYILDLVKRFTPGNSALGKCAWAFINDSHRTVMQIMYPPHVVAAAAFYFGKKFTQTEIPKGPDGKEWWEQYGVKIENLRDSVMVMVELYSALPQSKFQGKYPASMVSPQELKEPPSSQNSENATETGELKATEIKEKYQLETQNKPENGNIAKQGSESRRTSVSPMIKVSSPQHEPPSTSPIRRERGRSPRPSYPEHRGGKESYRPRSPDLYRSRSRGSRSRSRGRHRSHSIETRRVDWYSPERRRRDVYIPPRSPRKRVYEDESPRGREKRRRNSPDGDMSEGEVR